jgi:hypothetical protein
VDLLIALAPVIKDLLTADQLRKVPTFISSYLDTRYLAMIRSGTAGASSPFGGMDGAFVGGGGPAVIEIRR